MKRWLRPLWAVALGAAVFAAQAQDVLLTEKKVFELPSYTTVGGATIKQVRVGYETYGRLNAAGDNAVFIAHFYSGTSHAAGRYKPGDAAPGYWDAIIGPGKAIDTNRFFVVSADTLSNLNTKDPNVTTTGPSSINPDTGRPYGMSFPVIRMRDSVRVHKALLDALGVKKLYAVAGASGGAVQTMEWAVTYPDFVERAIAVIPPGLSISPWAIALLEAWVAPIKQDPKWNGGDYYGRDEPRDGVAQALKLVTLTARHWGWAEKAFGYKPADPARPPGDAIENRFLIEDTLVKAGIARAATTDANHKIYMAKANQLFDVEAEAGRIQAKVLFVPASSDLIFPPERSRKAADKLRSLGKRAEVFEIDGDGGHLDGVLAIGKAADAIRTFLAH
ncbi:homoserine O-acetyltransferase [Calidifontimicrobium sp. SYSU G02091]|uniref:E22 family MetX-like putative esterase n=1 Tax=Calidifontimicrobium sp. SYSU G02091 TaxID=2926421 RepID=UPI001F535314|nr:homoserine O-acetyltransferase [Calidifontimicrobium sp. SYSU G02091]MCI1191512.1 homoserine O-acetyltransferase [Calidifontimicrobium sp. SYSU G02091]